MEARIRRRWGRARTPLLVLMLSGMTTCSDAVGPDILAVAIAPELGLAVGVGGTALFSATALDAAGEPTISGDATWSTGDARIASVNGDGLATAIAAGTTTVTATVEGVSQTARLEVYVPDPVLEYVPGVSYFGRNGYVEYIPGELPIVLSAPHGGELIPAEIANRTEGVLGGDRNTAELTLAVRDALVDLTGHAPHVIISRLHRVKLDPNREVVEAAQGDPFAGQAWDEFQTFIEQARAVVTADFGAGMYFDMHGHGHARNRLELGYLLSSDRLNGSDASLSTLSTVQVTSIRGFGRASPDDFAALLRGPTSLGGLLEARGVLAIPSPGDPTPGSDPYFTGGYNTRRHGSIEEGEAVSGIQIEHHFPGVRDTDANRRLYATRLASALGAYMMEHFGFFDLTP